MDKNDILIKGSGISTIFLVNILKKFEIKFDLDISKNFSFTETFIDYEFYSLVKKYLGNDLKVYKSYLYTLGSLKDMGNIFFIGRENYKCLLNKINSDNSSGIKDYKYVFDSSNCLDENLYKNYYFSYINIYEITINNFILDFSLEYFDKENVPYYFYHIGGNKYLYGFYDISNYGLLELENIVNLFGNSINILDKKFFSKYKIYSKILIGINADNYVYFGSSYGFIPPYTGLGTKMVFLDCLKILDLLLNKKNINTFRKDFFIYRKFLFLCSSIIGKYIKKGFKREKYLMINSLMNKYLDSQIFKYNKKIEGKNL